MSEWEYYKPWANQEQILAIDALAKTQGNKKAAAEILGISKSAMHRRLNSLKRRAAKNGFSPDHDMTKTVPEGFFVKGVSSYYNKYGELTGQWVKSQKDKEEQLALLLEACKEIAEPIRGKSKLVRKPTNTTEKLLSVYPIGDIHFGMMAWGEETGGENFDLKIAEEEILTAFDLLIRLAPRTKKALIVPLGDISHADNQRSETTKGTKVDTDTRWPKVLKVIIRSFRWIIDKALRKHEEVEFWPVLGNHDEHTSFVVGYCLAQYYENNPRVTICSTPSRFHYLRFGKNLIGATHGDTVKARDLPAIMATDRKEDWGNTDHRFWLCGHVHHESVKEHRGVIVETYRTLAPADSWHYSHGYRAGRDIRLEIFHEEFGRINRHILGISQIQSLKAETK